MLKRNLQITHWGDGYFLGMPSLAETARMSRKRVYKVVCQIPTSCFYQMDPEKVEKDVKPQAALSYLVSIILVNDKAKSNLKKIKEVQTSPKNREHQDSLQESKASLSVLIDPR